MSPAEVLAAAKSVEKIVAGAELELSLDEILRSLEVSVSPHRRIDGGLIGPCGCQPGTHCRGRCE